MGVALLLLSNGTECNKNELSLFLQWKQDGNLWEESRGAQLCIPACDSIMHSPAVAPLQNLLSLF